MKNCFCYINIICVVLTGFELKNLLTFCHQKAGKSIKASDGFYLFFTFMNIRFVIPIGMLPSQFSTQFQSVFFRI